VPQKKNQQKLKKAVKPEEVIRFDSVSDLEEALKNQKLTWYDHIEIFFRHWYEKINDIPRTIKYFFQRGVRGWSDADLWGMHYYLTDLILNMIVNLKQLRHGYPCHMNDDQWGEILSEIQDGFAILKKCDDSMEEIEWGGYYKTDEEREQVNISMKKWKARITTREEEAKVERAFYLLVKHWHSLWD
jgi:hypothetical protein